MFLFLLLTLLLLLFMLFMLLLLLFMLFMLLLCVVLLIAEKTFRLGREKADLGSHLQEMEEELQVGSHKQKNKKVTDTQE